MRVRVENVRDVLLHVSTICLPHPIISLLLLGRITSLEDDVKQSKVALSKGETEKRLLQERLTDQEKVDASSSSSLPFILCPTSARRSLSIPFSHN